MTSSIDREYAFAACVALVTGVIVLVSLFLPWLIVVNEEIEEFNAFQVGVFTEESLGLAFATTAFNFLLLFGFLMIFGAILRLVKFDIGLHLIYAGALLSTIFTVLTLIISSFVAFLSPLSGQWVCLCSSIAALLSPKLQIRRPKQE